jgi:hypothetical protein
VVPLTSVYRAHHSLEGTRLTLVRQHNGYEYSIRTPNTPTRYVRCCPCLSSLLHPPLACPPVFQPHKAT